MVRKFLLLFLIFIFSVVAPVKIFAQQNNYPISTNSNVPQNFHNYTQSAFIEIFSALSCQLSGIDPTNPQGQCLGVDPKTGKIGFVKSRGGVVGFINGSIISMYNVPVSSGDYFKTLTSNFGIAKKAVAANSPVPPGPTGGGSVVPGEGAGFQSLLPFQALWRTMRNIVYVIFVLLFLFIGLGIMFRVKIDPRTVMTIQNQLPKIVVALILVTFSYAIAGFLVDMMNVSMYLGYGLVSDANGGKIERLTPADVQGTNPFGVAGKITNGNFGLAGLVSDVTGTAVGAIKDAVGLGPAGAPNAPKDLITHIPSVGGIFGFFTSIPGVDSLISFLSEIPGVGSIFGLIKDVGKYAVGGSSALNFSYINYFVHLVSVGAGLYAGFHAAQIFGALGGMFGAQGSLLGFGGGLTAGLQGWLGPAAGPVMGIAVFELTELILREAIPNLLGFFLVLSIFITALLRLWYQLLKAYVLVILGVIFAPFWIALGLIPGSQSMGFGPWIRNLAANLSVFPVTYIMFLVAKLLIQSISSSKTVFLPPFIGGQDASGFGALFGLGVILLTPQVLEMVRDFFKVQRFKYGAAISSSVAVGQQMLAAPIKGTTGKIWGIDPYSKKPKLLTRMALERQAKSTSRIGRALGKTFSVLSGEQATTQQERIDSRKSELLGNLARIQRKPSNNPKDQEKQKNEEANIRAKLAKFGLTDTGPDSGLNKELGEEIRRQNLVEIAKAKEDAEIAKLRGNTTPPGTETINPDVVNEAAAQGAQRGVAEGAATETSREPEDKT